MANEIHIGLNLRGEQPTTRGLKNVGGAAEKAGDGLQDMAKDAGFLDKRIGELRGGLTKLIVEFDRTGDKALLKKIGGEKRELGSLSRLKKQLLDLTPEAAEAGAKVGTTFGGSLMKSAAAAMSSGSTVLIAGIAAVVVAALPLIGGTLAFAVLGGAGVGGIIGGLALAAQDSRVKDAAAKLGEHALSEFGKAAEPFIAPAIEAMDILKGVTSNVAADMRTAFSTIAPVLVPLTRGIAGLVEKTMPGFLEAMESAKPVIRALAQELPKIGAALSDFFGTIAKDPDGAILALKTLSGITQYLIRQFGGTIALLSSIYEWMGKNAAAGNAFLVSLLGWVPGLGDVLRSNKATVDEMLAGMEQAKDGSGDFAGSLNGLADSASEAEQKMVDLQTAFDKFFGITMSLDQATIRYEAAIDNLSKSVKENGKTLDVHTEKGRANRSEILADIAAIDGMRTANINNKVSVEQANAIYDQQIEQLRRSAIRLGLNRAEVDKLINSYKNIPTLAESEVRIKGLSGALAKLRELAALLSLIPGGGLAGSLLGLVGKAGDGRARGGSAHAGQTYVVGENGPEVLQMGTSASGRVFSNAQSQAMMSSPAAGGVVEVLVSWAGPTGPAGDLGQALSRYLRFDVRTRGRGSAQVAYGR